MPDKKYSGSLKNKGREHTLDSFFLHMYVCVSRLVVSDSLGPHGLYSLPGSSVPGIFQARILEWVAISFSRKELGPQIIRCSEEQKCVLTNY